MKLSLSLSGINNTIASLQNAGITIQKDFKSELINQGNEIRDKAKEILQERSEQRTGQAYWTGRLYNAIKTTIDQNYDTSEMIGISVGVDLREAKYGEWVEIGHRKVSGWSTKKDVSGAEWWEGYHFLEDAYLNIAPTIAKQIADTLAIKLTHFARGTRTKSTTTGKFVKGFNIT